MRKLLALLAMFSMVVFTSCEEDDDDEPTVENLAAPEVSGPSATSVQIGSTVDLNFTFTAEAGFASASVSATGGTAEITTDGTADAKEGEILVTFTAGSTPGAGSVTLTLTDAEGDKDDATVVLTISTSPVPLISGIPASATITGGEKLGPVDATITMEDVPGTLTITKNGEAFATVDITTDGQVVAFEYESNVAESGSSIEFVFTATDSDEDVASTTHVLAVVAPEFESVIVESNITANTTWTADKIYELATRVTVTGGAELTIEAGTVIKGQPGTGANATALLVARGSKLFANGTADAPIIFTSTADDIVPGQIQSPNLAPDVNGLWGGVIVLGNTFISASAPEVQIEGIPASDPNGLYGGTAADTESSGSITYVSIRHGGANIGAGNEINGLSLGGIGSGTVVENIEVVANQDDGIEWFGGSVNVTNALIWNVGDDGMDTDQGWNGTMNDYIIVNPGGSCYELDGPEGSDADYFASTRNPLVHTFTNGVVYVGNSPAAVDFDADGNVDIKNTYFFGFNTSDGSPVQEYEAMTTGDVGQGSMTGIQVTLPSGKTVADIFVGVPAANVTAVDENANTVGSSADYSWTWASKSGALNEIGL